MKHINFLRLNGLCLTILLGLVAFAPAVAGNGVSEFNVDGLKVILKQSPKEVISVSLFVEGGVTNYSKAQQGIEKLAFESAMTGGTSSMNKSTFSAAAEKIGTRFSSNTTFDYGTMNMTCVTMSWDKSWSLFSDAILNPAFDADEFKLLKEQLISNSQAAAVDPDSHLRNMAVKSAFAGTAYENIPDGTPESLANLSLESVKKFYKSTVGKKRTFLVVVGNVDEADLRAKISGTLAKLPEGSSAKYEARKMIMDGGSYIEDRDIATNYIRGLMSAPTIDTEEGVAMWVAMSILQNRLFLEIRSKRGLSYAPAGFYSTGVLKNPYNALYVSTVDPKQSMEVMIAEVDKVKEKGFSEKELKNKKQAFLTRHLTGLETTSAQANALGTAEITGGWEMAENVTERVNKVTLEQLNKVFDTYTKSIQWTYLGKADMVEPDSFLQPKNSLELIRPKD